MNDDDSHEKKPSTIPAPPEEEDRSFDWARAFVNEGAFVMHLPTHTIGKIVRFYDGHGQMYRPDATKGPTKSPVLEMEQGHTFVAHPSAFLLISEKEVAFYKAIQAVVRDLLKQCASLGVKQGLNSAGAITLVSVALQEASTELKRGLAKMRTAILDPEKMPDPET